MFKGGFQRDNLEVKNPKRYFPCIKNEQNCKPKRKTTQTEGLKIYNDV